MAGRIRAHFQAHQKRYAVGAAITGALGLGALLNELFDNDGKLDLNLGKDTSKDVSNKVPDTKPGEIGNYTTKDGVTANGTYIFINSTGAMEELHRELSKRNASVSQVIFGNDTDGMRRYIDGKPVQPGNPEFAQIAILDGTVSYFIREQLENGTERIRELAMKSSITQEQAKIVKEALVDLGYMRLSDYARSERRAHGLMAGPRRLGSYPKN